MYILYASVLYILMYKISRQFYFKRSLHYIFIIYNNSSKIKHLDISLDLKIERS